MGNLSNRVGVVKKWLVLARNIYLSNFNGGSLAECLRGAFSECHKILNYLNWIMRRAKEHFLFMLLFWQVAVSYFGFNLIVLCMHMFFCFPTTSCFNFISHCCFPTNLLLVCMKLYCSSLFCLHVLFSALY